MNKQYLFLGGGLLLVLVVCVAVIHFEAEQTRQSIRQTARDEVLQGVQSGIQDPIAKASNTAVTEGGKLAAQVTTTIGEILGDVRSKAGDPANPGGLIPPGLDPNAVLGRVRDTLSPPANPEDPSAPRPASPLPSAAEVLDRLRNTVLPPPANPTDSTPPPVTKAPDTSSNNKGSAGSDPAGADKSNRSTKPSDTATSSDATSPKESTTASRTEPKGPTKPPAQSPDLVDSVLDLTRQVSQGGDQLGQQYLGLSEEEERAWGRKFHAQIVADGKIETDAVATARMRRVARPILDARRRPGIEYTFNVVKSDDDDLNAFSILGGYIYVHRALLKWIKTDHELQFLLGHEIGHVDLKHCSRQLTFSVRASELGTSVAGDVVGILHSLISRPYTAPQEYEADAYAFRAITAAGQTREQALSFPRRFRLKIREEEGEESTSGSSNSPVSRTAGKLRDHFSTHPPIDDRLARLEAMEPAPAKK